MSLPTGRINARIEAGMDDEQIVALRTARTRTVFDLDTRTNTVADRVLSHGTMRSHYGRQVVALDYEGTDFRSGDE